MPGEKWTAEDGTMEDKRQDPLEVMHEGDKRDDEKMLTEDEEYDLEMAFKNDPNFHRSEDILDESTEKDLYVEFIGGSESSADFAEDLEDGFKRADSGEEVPFEDQDLLNNALRNRIAIKNATPETKEEKPLYTPADFELMSRAASFKSIVELPPEVRKSQPEFMKGVPLSDERLAEHVAAYKECKKNNLWATYDKADLNFMKKCAEWDWFNRTILKNQELPKYADGSPLSDEDIKELATEYFELRKNNPTVFAEMKEKVGDWKKGYFKWKEGDYKGKTQWSCSKSLPTGDGKTSRTKYVTSRKPSIMDGESYYVVNRSNNIKTQDGSLSYVDIGIKELPVKKNQPVYSETPNR